MAASGEHTGLALVAPQRVGDLSLGNPVVQSLIETRTHVEGANLDDSIVTPGALADSAVLERFARFPW